jgi:hypothetical protein
MREASRASCLLLLARSTNVKTQFQRLSLPHKADVVQSYQLNHSPSASAAELRLPPTFTHPQGPHQTSAYQDQLIKDSDQILFLFAATLKGER